MENYEMEKALLEDLENDPLLNGLCEWLRDNQPKMQILNVRRYYEMLIAKAAFDDVLKKNWDSEPSTVEMNPTFACVLPPSVIVGKQTALCVGGSRGYLAQAE